MPSEEKGKQSKQSAAIPTSGKLVLNEEKTIRGKKVAAGTVVAEVKCAGNFDVNDVNRAMQLNQLSIA